MNKNDSCAWLDEAKSGLRALGKGTSREDRKAIKQTLELLNYFDLLQGSVDDLWRELSRNSAVHVTKLTRFPDHKQGWDILAAIYALNAVLDFLRFSPSKSVMYEDRYRRFKILDELRQALLDLAEGGAPAPILRSLHKTRGRRADGSLVLAMKGILAALMHRQQCAGMSRHQAAKWIADNMSPKLAVRISQKPITSRVVEEWLDRFGGQHAEHDSGRKAYLVWSQDTSPLTKKLFRTITERIAAGDY